MALSVTVNDAPSPAIVKPEAGIVFKVKLFMVSLTTKLPSRAVSALIFKKLAAAVTARISGFKAAVWDLSGPVSLAASSLNETSGEVINNKFIKESVVIIIVNSKKTK